MLSICKKDLEKIKSLNKDEKELAIKNFDLQICHYEEFGFITKKEFEILKDELEN